MKSYLVGKARVAFVSNGYRVSTILSLNFSLTTTSSGFDDSIVKIERSSLSLCIDSVCQIVAYFWLYSFNERIEKKNYILKQKYALWFGIISKRNVI